MRPRLFFALFEAEEGNIVFLFLNRFLYPNVVIYDGERLRFFKLRFPTF